MRKFYCEVCRSLAHTCASSGGNFDCYRNETAPRGTTAEVIGPRPSFRSVERTVRRRYGNSLMREDKIELMGTSGKRGRSVPPKSEKYLNFSEGCSLDASETSFKFFLRRRPVPLNVKGEISLGEIGKRASGCNFN